MNQHKKPFSNTDIIHTYKTDYAWLLHLRQLEILVVVNTLLNLHVFAHACDTELSHSESMHNKCMWQKKAKSSLIYTIVCLSLEDTGVSHQMAFISKISSKWCKTLQLLRSSGNRQTHKLTSDYYNPPPMPGLKIISFCYYNSVINQ